MSVRWIDPQDPQDPQDPGRQQVRRKQRFVGWKGFEGSKGGRGFKGFKGFKGIALVVVGVLFLMLSDGSGSTSPASTLPVAVPIAAPAAAEEDLPWRNKGSPFGFEAALGNRVRAEEIDAAMVLMRESGVQWQREEIFWDRVQTAPGAPYVWTGNGSGFFNYDRAIHVQVQSGIRIMGLLDYNPAWFKGQNPPIDAWINDWGDFVYNAVARYGRDRGWVKYWELWNEPNVAHFGYGGGLNSPDDFVRILEVGRAAAKAADPEAQIVMGGISCILEQPEPSYDCFDYLRRIGDAGAWEHTDILAVHFYHADAPENQVQRYDRHASLRDELLHLDALLRRYGPRPVWITEIGWSTTSGWPGVDGHSQAFFLVRSFMLALTHPSVEKVFWYDFRNDTWPHAVYERPAYNSHETEFHFGLLNRTYPFDPNRPDLRKPAFVAFRAMTRMLGGQTPQEIVSDGNEGLYWYRFGGVGRRVDVIWRTLDGSPEVVEVACGCHEAMVRSWDGSLNHLLTTSNGVLHVRLDALGAPIYVEYDPPVAAEGGEMFATGKPLQGAFRSFWYANQGAVTFGYPLTGEIIEPEDGSGRPRVVQYFERARFEHHPELSNTPGEVKLGRLGAASLDHQGIDWFALPKVDGPPSEECLFFEHTGHSLCPPFRAVWEQYGQLPILGYPLSEPMGVAHPSTGEPYTVQYFERARLEYPTEQGDRKSVV